MPARRHRLWIHILLLMKRHKEAEANTTKRPRPWSYLMAMIGLFFAAFALVFLTDSVRMSLLIVAGVCFVIGLVFFAFKK